MYLQPLPNDNPHTDVVLYGSRFEKFNIFL